jgi:quercetin dioxygenase-like cupin family protein
MTALRTDTALVPLLARVAAATAGTGSHGLTAISCTSTRGEMPPLHVHDEDEAFHVAEGSVTFYVGGDAVRLEAGEAFVAPKGIAHTHRAESDRARVLSATFVRSASRYEDFTRAVARPRVGSADGAAREFPSDAEGAALATIAERNGITLLGPPGMLPDAAEWPLARRAAA